MADGAKIQDTFVKCTEGAALSAEVIALRRIREVDGMLSKMCDKTKQEIDRACRNAATRRAVEMASANLKRRRRWGINHKILDEMGGSGPLFDNLPATVCVRIFSLCEESGSRGAWHTAVLCYRLSFAALEAKGRLKEREARERLEKLLQRAPAVAGDVLRRRDDGGDGEDDDDCCDGLGGHAKHRLESLYIRGRRKQEARKSSAFGGGA